MIDASTCPFVDKCPAVVLNLDEYGLPKTDEPAKVCQGCNKEPLKDF